MARLSAGLLLFRRDSALFSVLLVHPGGPWWAKRDQGAWSIPKGECDDEDPKRCARREFEEELGHVPPASEWIDLGEVLQRGGKRVRCWAVQGDLDVQTISSNTFELEWPPRSGRLTTFPEVDRAMWYAPEEATRKLMPAQVAFLDRLRAHINEP